LRTRFHHLAPPENVEKALTNPAGRVYFDSSTKGVVLFFIVCLIYGLASGIIGLGVIYWTISGINGEVYKEKP